MNNLKKVRNNSTKTKDTHKTNSTKIPIPISKTYKKTTTQTN